VRLEELLIEHEGLRLFPYRCTSGKLTIGVGRNLEDRGISRDEAELMLKNDILACLEEAQTLPFFATLVPARKDVIVSMIFNLGFSRFLQFHRTLELIQENRFQEASEEMLRSLWARQVKKRAQVLASMMATGEYLKVS
jgi:lysozyme